MTTHLVGRFLDLVVDPRMPHNFLATWLRSRGPRRMMSRSTASLGYRILVALTFDVEQDHNSDGRESASSVSSFLTNVQHVVDEATIFAEGRLVEANSEQLRSLEERGFEIGLHGYRHELWGSPQWYLHDKPVPNEGKNSLLKDSLRAFRTSRLHRPTAFRAPSLVADDSTIRLLVANGFGVDSSLPSHRGVLPVPQFVGGADGLVRIPVSVDPVPSLARRTVFPYYRFRVCNLKTLKEMDRKEFLEYTTRIATLQEALGFPPHLVLLSHSWEFSEPLSDRKDYSYRSISNFEFINDLLCFLSKNFSVKQTSITKLAAILRKSYDDLSREGLRVR